MFGDMLRKIWQPVFLQFHIKILCQTLTSMQLEPVDYTAQQITSPEKAIQWVVHLMDYYTLTNEN